MRKATIFYNCMLLQVFISSEAFNPFCFPESSQAAKYGGCFSGQSTVLTSTGERRKLSELRIGESVLAHDSATDELVFSRVIMFLDYDPKQRREFLQISLSSGRTLTVTPSHLLVNADTARSVRFADKFKPGDKLLVSDSKNKLVTDVIVSIKPILLTGVYAPLTTVGTVVVNDVIASCYATVDNQSIAHWALLPARLVISAKDGIHRMWSLLSRPVTAWSISKTVTARPSVGVHWYARFLYIIGEFVIPSLIYK